MPSVVLDIVMAATAVMANVPEDAVAMVRFWPVTVRPNAPPDAAQVTAPVVVRPSVVEPMVIAATALMAKVPLVVVLMVRFPVDTVHRDAPTPDMFRKPAETSAIVPVVVVVSVML